MFIHPRLLYKPDTILVEVNAVMMNTIAGNDKIYLGLYVNFLIIYLDLRNSDFSQKIFRETSPMSYFMGTPYSGSRAGICGQADAHEATMRPRTYKIIPWKKIYSGLGFV